MIEAIQYHVYKFIFCLAVLLSFILTVAQYLLASQKID